MKNWFFQKIPLQLKRQGIDMKKTGGFLRYFDKVFFTLAACAASAIFIFAVKPNEKVWTSSKVEEQVKILNERGRDMRAAEVPYTFKKHSALYNDLMALRATPQAPDGWSLYRSPTARPFVTVTPTPVKELSPIMPPVSVLSAVSVPGRTTLTWERPKGITDLRFEAYYLFRIEGNKQFGSHIFDGKLKIVLGEGEQLDEPLAGPIKETTFIDRSIRPDTMYKYVVVAIGYPGRMLMKDGKPILGGDGEPVYEVVSAQPVASVSKALKGATVPEFQIYLKAVIDNVAGNFTIHKWMREQEEWVNNTFIKVMVGDQIGDTVRMRGQDINFSTGWYLDKLGTEQIEVGGVKRNVSFALLVSYGAERKYLKVYETKARDPEAISSEFSIIE